MNEERLEAYRTTTNPEDYFNFLMEVLETVAENPSPKSLYPLLQKNLDKLDENFGRVLKNWSTNILSILTKEKDKKSTLLFCGNYSSFSLDAQSTARLIGNFSDLLEQFPLGNIPTNIEIAIVGLEIALTVLTFESYPSSWARMQNNLGCAYKDRVKGEKKENIEKAITCYQKSLKVYSLDKFPDDWANAQNNIGDAYLDRLKDDRAENIEKGIAHLNQSLQVYTLEVFPYEWARTQYNLGNAYIKRIKGDKEENLEVAITCYEKASQVRTFEAFPKQWAATQNNLGSIYYIRIKGNKKENLEQSISFYKKALQVKTFEAYPQDWGNTQYHLGIAYAKYSEIIKVETKEYVEKAIACFQQTLQIRTFETCPEEWADTQIGLGFAYFRRIEGYRRENLEEAISCYEKASQVYTLETFPQQWAMLQNNLGEVYRFRIEEEHKNNLEKAISYYNKALKIWTFENFSEDWAGAENNLGLAYWMRIAGDKAENLEQAIAHLQQALRIYTLEDFPQRWASTQSNLGITYLERIKGNRGENLEQAIAYFQQAKKVYTLKTWPQKWAYQLHLLGLAYFLRIKGDRGKNLEQAIAYSQQALEIRTIKAFPIDWADTQINLGITYMERVNGEEEQNLEQAIICYKKTLRVYGVKTFPSEWAKIQHNLGVAYSNRLKGDREKNLELAIAHYKKSLEIYTLETFPHKFVGTLSQLGIAYQHTNKPASAYTTFASAIATVDFLREEIVSGEESKRKQAEEWNALYRRMVELCLKLGNKTEAIEYIERSKTRNLVEQLLNRDLKTIFPPDIVTQLEQYREEITAGQYQIQHRKGENPIELSRHLQELRQKRNELQNRYLPIGSGFQFEHFQNNLDERTAIVEFYITGDKLLTFIFTHQTQQPKLLQSQPKVLQKLAKWLIGYLQAYDNHKIWQRLYPEDSTETPWQHDLTTRLHLLSQILRIDEIIQQIPPESQRLILIPHRFLHLLPLHALSINSQQGEAKSEILMHRFPAGVSYAPSCQLLQLAQTRKRPKFTKLFAVQNPTDNLEYTDLEVEVIQSFFPPAEVEILASKKASEAAVKVNQNLTTAHCCHFSCHGSFRPESPLESALVLAETETERIVQDKATEDGLLTLGEIFGFNLNQCRLVTLSACETGLIDFNNISDEYIGLPSGFLVAGSPAVVSSLWTVNQLSCALLLIKFYENLQKQMSLGVALNQAQLWLRDATKEDLQTWTGKLSLDSTWKRKIRHLFKKMEAGSKPFQSPYHWAAFTAVGE